MPPSSRGLGRSPFKAEIAGSNPAGGTPRACSGSPGFFRQREPQHVHWLGDRVNRYARRLVRTQPTVRADATLKAGGRARVSKTTLRVAYSDPAQVILGFGFARRTTQKAPHAARRHRERQAAAGDHVRNADDFARRVDECTTRVARAQRD
jgi:hypothetical protein